MGIFGALSTAISGLQAQSTALSNISNNIANSQTTAFKRTETSFEEIVTTSGGSKAGSGVVRANSVATNTVSGDILPSDVDTHVAINGDGYFIVAEQTGVSDGKPIFGDVPFYTRVGDFEVNRDGYLENSSGYVLQGIEIDAGAGGNLAGNDVSVIQISNEFLAAQNTTTVEYRANLATTPQTASYDSSVPGSELLRPLGPAPVVDPGVGGAGVVSADNVAEFLTETVTGGAITAYTATGAPVNVQIRWGKVDSPTNPDATTTGKDVWNAFYKTDGAATNGETAWANFGQNYVFNSQGTLDEPSSGGIKITDLTVNGTNLGDISIDHRSPNGTAGLSQFDDSNGVAQVNVIDQNGYPSGELSSIAITDVGRVTGIYTNGESVDLAEVTLFSFNADGALRKEDGGAFSETPDSGSALQGAQGSIVNASLESSNTDIADEFSKLIVTQQAYAAGTRIVTTADEMLQEALSMVR